MGTITGKQILDKAAEVLEDTVGGAFLREQGLAWLNEGQREITFLRPDASSTTVVQTLVAGTKQTLPAGSRRLLSVVRNMGVAGATPGRAVRGPVSQQYLDGFNPNWHAANSAQDVREYMYNPLIPEIYYVSPPAKTTSHLELLVATLPADLTVETGPITIADIYESRLLDWILYRFLSRFSDDTPEGQEAARYLQTFTSLLGAKSQIDAAIDPREQRRGGSRD